MFWAWVLFNWEQELSLAADEGPRSPDSKEEVPWYAWRGRTFSDAGVEEKMELPAELRQGGLLLELEGRLAGS